MMVFRHPLLLYCLFAIVAITSSRSIDEDESPEIDDYGDAVNIVAPEAVMGETAKHEAHPTRKSRLLDALAENPPDADSDMGQFMFSKSKSQDDDDDEDDDDELVSAENVLLKKSASKIPGQDLEDGSSKNPGGQDLEASSKGAGQDLADASAKEKEGGEGEMGKTTKGMMGGMNDLLEKKVTELKKKGKKGKKDKEEGKTKQDDIPRDPSKEGRGTESATEENNLSTKAGLFRRIAEFFKPGNTKLTTVASEDDEDEE